jgi:hypothetical protein
VPIANLCVRRLQRVATRAQRMTTGDHREVEEGAAGTPLIDLIGADRVCFGSDYLHAEGLAGPLDWMAELDGIDAATVEQLMSTNMFDLVHLARPGAA